MSVIDHSYMRERRHNALIESCLLRVELWHPHLPPHLRRATAVNLAADSTRGMRQKCQEHDCDTPAKAHGLCPKHYLRLRRNGHTALSRVAATDEERAERHRQRMASRRAKARTPNPPLPFQPLWDYVQSTRIFEGGGETLSFDTMAMYCDVSNQTVFRWARQGWLPMNTADTVATRLGHHPSAIWPEWWDLAA